MEDISQRTQDLGSGLHKAIIATQNHQWKGIKVRGSGTREMHFSQGMALKRFTKFHTVELFHHLQNIWWVTASSGRQYVKQQSQKKILESSVLILQAGKLMGKRLTTSSHQTSQSLIRYKKSRFISFQVSACFRELNKNTKFQLCKLNKPWRSTVQSNTYSYQYCIGY